ncbi:hypothetical protein [Corynebacterium mastitidis]|nr:hypothetical protein [Corynebacterium mastitidis]MDK8450621.1 hypothetical protein [Corynebacterium mastitidis]
MRPRGRNGRLRTRLGQMNRGPLRHDPGALAGGTRSGEEQRQ